jgi:predicted amino acid-binding ACT domain protein
MIYIFVTYITIMTAIEIQEMGIYVKMMSDEIRKNNTTGGVDRLPNYTPTDDKPSIPNVTIEQLTDMIKPPLSVVKDAVGIVHDISTILVKCNIGHIHRHYTSDIIQIGYLRDCKTCTRKDKRLTAAREAFETVFMAPFVVKDNIPGVIYNPRLGITYRRVESTEKSEAKLINDGIEIQMWGYTEKYLVLKSLRSIAASAVCKQYILPDGTTINSKLIKTSYKNAKGKYVLPPLPWTTEHAKSVGIDPVYILDDDLLSIENCVVGYDHIRQTYK